MGFVGVDSLSLKAAAELKGSTTKEDENGFYGGLSAGGGRLYMIWCTWMFF